MSEYALTRRAEADLFDIFLFGYEQFGVRQAEIYAAELEHTFQLLADNPRMGREAAAIALAHVPAKWTRFAEKDMRQHGNLRRFPVILDHRVIQYDREAL
jgi:plasmid stabilization system protein ParE